MSDGMFLGIKSGSSWATGSLDATSSRYNLLTGRLIYWHNGFWLYIFTVAVRTFCSLLVHNRTTFPNFHTFLLVLWLWINTISPNLIIKLTFFPVVWFSLNLFKYSFVHWFQYDSNSLCKYFIRFDKLLVLYCSFSNKFWSLIIGFVEKILYP